MNIYIISWFGKSNIAHLRRNYHKRQIEWAFENNLQPVVLAQEYQNSDYINGVTYIDSNSDRILLPAEARNIVLRKFYETDEDFGIIADNDTIIYEKYGDGKVIIDFFRSLDVKKFPIDIISLSNPTTHLKKGVLEIPRYQNNLVFNKTYYASALFFLKNLKKYHNTELYNDSETFVDKYGKLITCEDHDFCINGMLNHGLNVYSLRNVYYREFGRSKSTWVDVDSNRNTIDAKKLINEKYKKKLYLIPESNVRMYPYIGTFVTSTGISKVAFHRNRRREKVIINTGCTDVKFYRLPKHMSAEEGVSYCIENDLYDIKKVVSEIEQRGEQILSKSHTDNAPIRFNWKVCSQLKRVPNQILVPKRKELKKLNNVWQTKFGD